MQKLEVSKLRAPPPPPPQKKVATLLSGYVAIRLQVAA